MSPRALLRELHRSFAGAALWIGLAAGSPGSATAEVPLPSYRAELVRAVWVEADQAIQAGDADGAICAIDRFTAEVTEDASLVYLRGLALRLKGDPAGAEAAFSRALALDPRRFDAKADLGELLLLRGDLAGAEALFTEIAAEVTEGRGAFIGPFRLADLAARRRDAAAFEAHLREALRRGFSFTYVAEDPTWRGYARDPALEDAFGQLLLSYADDETRRRLRE